MLKTIQREKIDIQEAFSKKQMQFFIEKMPQIETQNDKNSRIHNFENFMQFLSIFRKTWWLRMSKTVNKENVRCLGGFLEEIKAICVEKTHQIWTEVDKIFENSDF